MSDETLLTFNAGSSTVKIGLFKRDGDKALRIAKGVIDLRHDPLNLKIKGTNQQFELTLQAKAQETLTDVVAETMNALVKHFDIGHVSAIGHRVVHGGDLFDGPATINDETLEKIRSLIPLAPLHQAQSLRLIEAVRQIAPDLAQSASFDTAFHRTASDTVRRFAIPRHLHDQGIKRYGFHGLSYQYVITELKRLAPHIADKKVIIAHLGSGASLCALDEGLSRDTSMGFSTLDGIPMATRCGAIDPGVLLHLLGQQKLSCDDVENLLYHQSGLLGVSGISADSRDLVESSDPHAIEALDLLNLRMSGEIARLAATIEGIDAIVFTAGVGEHQPAIRAGVCERLKWLGVTLDDELNQANARCISDKNSKVQVYVIPTDEEQIIADETLKTSRKL